MRFSASPPSDDRRAAPRHEIGFARLPYSLSWTFRRWAGIERSFPELPGPLALQLTLPDGRAGEAMPLVITGVPHASDFLYVLYTGPTTVKFAYDSWGHGGPFSEEIAIEPGVAKTLVVEMPSLAAATKPDARGRAPMRIAYDGREVLRGDVRFHSRAASEIFFGANPVGGTGAGPTLRGTIASGAGQRLAGRPSNLFPFSLRLRLWLTQHPWQVLAALLIAFGTGFAGPILTRHAVALIRRPRSALVFAGHERPPHAWFAGVAALCTLAFVAVITGFGFQLNFRESFGDFYDFQAAGLLRGRLDVPPEALQGESFVFAGKTYGYFGPTPAVLRVPFALAGAGFDKLSRSYMVAYYVASLAAVYALLIFAARVLSGRATWPSRLDVTLVVGGAGLASPLFFLSSRAYIYHEAILCGAAFALWSAWFALRFLAEPGQHRWWLGALGCGVASVHARPPAGLFALALLGSVALALAWGAWRSTPAGQISRRLRSLRLPALVAVLATAGILSFSGLSYLKFKSFEGAPLRYHVQYNAARLAVIEGRNFHPGNLPYNFECYVWRPNFLLRPVFPYFYIEGRSPDHYAGTHIDLPEPTLGLPYSTPALVLLALTGLALALLRWPAAREPLGVVLAGTIPMAAALFTAIAVSHRYTVDFAPPLLVCAAFGVSGLAALSPGWRNVLRSAAAVLTLAALLVTLATTLHYQAERVWGVPEDVKQRHQMLRQAVDSALGFSRP